MSYARFGEGDVYVVCKGIGFECCACRLLEDYQSFLCNSQAEMLDHMKEHIRVGHDVPEDCIERLEQEIAENSET